LRSNCHDLSFLTYFALAAGTLVLLNVLIVALVAIVSRFTPPDDADVERRI
jgi:hypothetical protein